MTTRTPASEKPVQLDVSILVRDSKSACRVSELAEHMQAVALFAGRMRESRDTGKIAAVDRIAVMAALNLANELLRARAAPKASTEAAPIDDSRARRRIEHMQSAIDQLMAGQEKLL